RGIQIRMSEPLLELKRRDPFLCFVGGEGMPERVATCPLYDPGVFAVLHHELSHTPLRNGLTLVIQKEDVGEALRSDHQIVFERLHSPLLQCNLPLLIPFSPYSYLTFRVTENRYLRIG